MNRRTFLALTSSAGAGGLLGCTASRGRSGATTPTTQGGFTLLTVEGDAFERGAAHGEALRTSIHETVELWKGSLSAPEGTSREQYLADFARATDFATAITQHTPELMDEMRGLAAGSGVPFETVYALQMIDEEWCYATALQWETSAEAEKGDKCSVLALARDADHPTLVAQNLDVPETLGRHMVLLRHVDRTSGLDALILTIPGGLALNGMNARGVAVCVNAMLPLRSARRGLPVACVIRGALERPNLAAAARFVREVSHASPQCYTLGDPASIECLEASAGKVERAFAGAKALAHTNHPVANDDLGPLGKWVAEQPDGAVPGMRNSRARLDACTARLGGGKNALASVQAALGSHDRADDPVCRHREPEGALTAACTIYELRAGRPTLHVAANPPCSGEFQEHRLG